MATQMPFCNFHRSRDKTRVQLLQEGLRFDTVLHAPYGELPAIISGISSPAARHQFNHRQSVAGDQSALMPTAPDIGNAVAMAVYAHLTKWQCSRVQSDELLRILRDSAQEPPVFTHATMSACQSSMDAWDAAEGRGQVQHVDLLEECDGPQDMNLYMRPAMDAVTDLLRDPEFTTRMSWGHDLLVNRSGERVFSSASSGLWWEMVVESHASHQHAVGVILSPDAMVVTKKRIAHGVYITLNNIPEDQRCSARAYVLVGLIPVWSRSKSQYASQTDKNRILAARRKQQVHSKSLHFILRSLTTSAQRGGTDVLCGDGLVRCVVPILSNIATDIPEGQTITFGRPLECFACYAPRHTRTHAPGTHYESMTVSHVKSQVLHALESGKYGDDAVWGSMYESDAPRAKPFCMMQDGVVQVST